MALKLKVSGTFEQWKEETMAKGELPDENLKWLLPEWSYLAGIIDGEGSIVLYIVKRKGSRKSTFRLHLSVSQCSEWFLNRLKTRFGGNVFKYKDKLNQTKAAYYIQWANFYAGWILWNVYPHLMLKREQAKIAFQFLHNLRKTNGQRLSEEDVELRKMLRHRMMALNGSQRRS